MFLQKMTYSNLLKKTKHSFDGLTAVFKTECAFRAEAILCGIGITCLTLMRSPLCLKALFFGSLILVLIAEAGNTAIERLTDRISLKTHPLSKQIKDIGSAIVFLSLINAFGMFIFLCLG